MLLPAPSPKVFSAVLSGDIKGLARCSQDELRPFLPCLARLVLSSPTPSFAPLETLSPGQREKKRKIIHALIANMEEVNTIREYLSINFQELKHDALKEQQLLKKLSPGEERGQSQSVLASSIQFGLAIEFERSNHLRRFRLFVSEILRLLSAVESLGPFKFVQSDLFECEVHVEEICDILCIACAELPSLLPPAQLSEGLLRLEKGPYLLTRLIANMPFCFDQVVSSLVLNGETLDEVSLAGRCRTAAIRKVCHMHPTRSAYVQTLAVNHCKHPTLALLLALESEDKETRALSGDDAPAAVKLAGVVTLLHNIIIAGDEQTRAWFAQYLKCMQQKYRRHKYSAVTKLRSFIMKKLYSFIKPKSKTGLPAETRAVQTTIQEEQMEADSELVIDASGKLASTAESIVVHESDTVGAMASAETLEELVDQMEIEISDQEQDGEVEESGEIVLDKEGSQEVKSSSEQVASATEKVKTTMPAGEDSVPGNSSAQSAPERRRRRSSTFERIDFPPISLDIKLSDESIIELTELIQVCCALRTQTQMYLKEEEAAAILSVIVSTCPPFSLAGVKFVEVSLCVLLACPFLISMDGCEAAVVRWFKWLLEKLPVFDRACGGHCSYGELLLLVAIHLREKHLEQIEELIATTLHMKVSNSLRSGQFSSLTKLYLRVFNEDVVCVHAVSVPPTVNLSAEMSGYLPVHCVHQLIKMRVFRKHGISIKGWIYRQLLTVSEPLHPTLPPLLQEFVNSVLLSSITTGPRSSSYNPTGAPTAANNNHIPFSAEEVLAVFRQNPDSVETNYPIASQLLMLYYILLYQDCYLANLKSLLMQSSGSIPHAYSPTVMTQIPVKHLLDHAQCHHGDYSTLYPTLLKLAATQFPQLCLVCKWLTEEKAITVTKCHPVVTISMENFNPESALQVLSDLSTAPSQALLVLNHLTTLTPSALIPYTHTITSIIQSLIQTPSISRRIQDLFVTLWTKLNAVIPRRLWLETVNALQPLETQCVRPITHQNLTEDPLIILRCDSRVFRCPHVFDILLRLLSVYTTTSRAWLQERSYIQSCAAIATPESMTSSSYLTKPERDELCIALTAAQESAIVQLLLEICLPTEDDKKEEAMFGSQLTVMQEIRCLVCSYFHSTFIADPNLVKLVHFQGYPTELLPMMVSGVPSMHICLDFIPELLAQAQTDKQQFGVQLAAHIIQQYPLPDAMGVAKDIFKRLMVLANEVPQHSREDYFLPLLPSVTMLCQTFPPLCKDATEFLVHLSKICETDRVDMHLLNGPGREEARLKSQKGTIEFKGNTFYVSVKNTFHQLVSDAIIKL